MAANKNADGSRHYRTKLLAQISKLALARRVDWQRDDDACLFLHVAYPFLRARRPKNPTPEKEKLWQDNTDFAVENWLRKTGCKEFDRWIIESRGYREFLKEGERARILMVTAREYVGLELTCIRPTCYSRKRFDEFRKTRKRRKNRMRSRAARRRKGAKPRSESRERQKPWDDLNVCRSKFYELIKADPAIATAARFDGLKGMGEAGGTTDTDYK